MRISVDVWSLDRVRRGAACDAADFQLIAHGEGGGALAAAGLAAQGPQAATHLTSSCRGVLSAAGASGAGSVGVFSVADPGGDFGSGLARFDDLPPRRAAQSALRGALQRAGRPGEAPDLVWLTASPGYEEDVIAGLQDVVGDQVPILGGSAADDHVAGRWSVGTGGARATDGVAVSALFPTKPVAYAFQGGYAPTGQSGVATAVAGRRVLTIDGAPAARVYADWLDRPDWRGPRDAPLGVLGDTALAPLGREVARLADVPYHVLAHPAALHPDGSMELFADIAEGERLHLMSGSADSLIARAGRVAAQAVARSGLEPDQIAGALMVYCGGCMMAVADRMDEAARPVSRALGGAPFLGLFTFGEQGPVLGGANRHGNLMISCVVFGR